MVYTASKRLRKVMAVVLLLVYVSGLLVSISGAVFPYSGGESPTPKRLFLQVSLAKNQIGCVLCFQTLFCTIYLSPTSSPSNST